MPRILRNLTLIGATMLLISCGMKLEPYGNQEPAMDLKAYFNGPIKAWGIVQDYSGEVVSRFDVEMVGEWDGDTGTLKEYFTYYDGSTMERTWNLKKTGPNSFEGHASDIIGVAKGETRGSAARWNYTMDLPVKGTTYRVKFDDWMWRMNDGVLVNRSFIKKFGITVAELTIFMQKQ